VVPGQVSTAAATSGPRSGGILGRGERRAARLNTTLTPIKAPAPPTIAPRIPCRRRRCRSLCRGVTPADARCRGGIEDNPGLLGTIVETASLEGGPPDSGGATRVGTFSEQIRGVSDGRAQPHRAGATHLTVNDTTEPP
jgi:hypothetical protein